jgi:hypothetical protein
MLGIFVASSDSIWCSERRLIGHRLTRARKNTIEASITLDGVTVTDSLIRWSPIEWSLVCREIPVSAGKISWTSSKPGQWTLCSLPFSWWISYGQADNSARTSFRLPLCITTLYGGIMRICRTSCVKRNRDAFFRLLIICKIMIRK